MNLIKKIFECANDTPFEFPVFVTIYFVLVGVTIGTFVLAVDLYQILIRPLLISWAENL